MRTNLLKSILVLATFALYLLPAFGQTPEKMSYQAVIRNSNNALVANTEVTMQISILQGSVNGTVVYSETQTPTTNGNGLVSIEIGGEVGFSAIDWANDIYFIKTETGLDGGSNYTIIGTSQLMSVPYALHAKTAEIITGEITETDPVYEMSPAANISTTDIVNLSSLSGSNTGDQDISGIAINTQAIQDTANQIRSDMPAVADGSETKVTAGANVSVTGVGTAESPYVVNATSGSTLAIGDSYQGGIIFWLDETGEHGLIAATSDYSTGLVWHNEDFTTTHAVRDGIGAGKFNTERIIANQGAGDYAAQVCANHQGGNYGDWYLPSKYELSLLFLQSDVVNLSGGNPGIGYWSSTEVSSTSAWAQEFDGAAQISGYKASPYKVRPIRSF